MPKSRLGFWRTKLEGNRNRDQKNEMLLRSLGWDVLVVWECQLRDRQALERLIRGFLQ